jgi:hypothetical protein
MKFGNLHFSATSIYLIWDDDPHCPKPFPLILTRNKKIEPNNQIRISKDANTNIITLFSKHVNIKDFVWAGTETIRIEKNVPNHILTQSIERNPLIQILTHQ